MPYLIDGHNLIPRIPGLSLKDLDDETALIQILQRFAARQGSRVEVYFDRAPPGQAAARRYGSVKAHFIRQGKTADQAIIERLSNLGAEAKNWTVVTSDREIIAEVRSNHSRVIKSEEFSKLLRDESAAGAGDPSGKDQDPQISSGDVEYWLDQFKDKN
jgi:predicted RNA-binding protein with PIN domain